MRIGSSVLLSNQTCVQSYNWSCLRPLGRLQTVIDELEHFECDEIAIVRPVRIQDSIQDFENDTNILRKLKSMTPVSFGGGIRSIKHLELIDGLPIERLILTSAFLSEDKKLLENVIKHFGRQSIQCLLPVVMVGKEPCIYHCTTEKLLPLKKINIEFICRYSNEVIIHDCNHEGKRDQFDYSILDYIGIDKTRLVISGGIGQGSISKGIASSLASVLIDNKTIHEEYSVAGYKHAANM